MGKTGQNPAGVKPRESAIQIKFKLQGEDAYCYETIQWAPTSVNVARAGRLRAEIVEKIKHGVFSYAEYFPNSRKAENNQGTFLVFAQAWLDSPTNDWTKQTRYKFRGILNRVWIPSLHDQQIRLIPKSKITAALFAAIAAFKDKNNSDPSESLYNDWLLCIRGVFEIAIDAGAIKRLENPTQDLVNKTRNKTDADPFDTTEANDVINVAYAEYGEVWGAWFELGFYSGMRYPSEPSALLWSDVNLAKGEIRINKIMTKGGLQNSTKTGKSRTLMLNSRSVSALERLKAVSYELASPLFQNRLGGSTLEAKAQRTMWRTILDKLKLRYRAMYNMRHTYATFGLMNGVNPAFMAGQLGHSVEEFFKTYAKWINNNQNQLQIDLIEAAINRANAVTLGHNRGVN